MIPFSILSGRIQLEGNDKGEDLEIRVLELAYDSFQFRFPISWVEEEDCLQIKSISLHFFNQEKSCYEKIILKDFDYVIEEKNRYWLQIRVSTIQGDFKKASQHLSKEYLSYIHHKLSEDDVTLSSRFSFYPADGEESFLENESEQEEYWYHAMKTKIRDMDVSSKVSSLKLSLFMDNPDKLNRFLSIDFNCYLKTYWEEHGLSFHPFSKMSVYGIHIGNPYCIHLLPKEEDWAGILEKAAQLEITFVLPPIAQSFYKKIVNYLKLLHHLLSQQKRFITLEVNDMGMYDTLLYDSGFDSNNRLFPYFHVIKGTMLHKKIKDSRMHYRYPWKNNPPFPLDHSEQAIYLPYYQMNTSTFCTLYAACHYGDRGHQDRILACDRPCLTHSFLYPSHLSMIGRYNSLLGFNLESMTEIKKLDGEISKETEWMVINL